MSKSLGAFSLCAALLIPGAPLTPAESASSPEYTVKAAFLYNFAKFVEWPAAHHGDFVIGILGTDPFGPQLDQAIEHKTILGRPIIVKRFSVLADRQPCDVLFISASEEKRLPAVLEAIEGMPTLTVSEIEGFAEQGGMINFFLRENRVRFEINVEAANRAALPINVQLLKLARMVQERARRGSR